MLFVPPFSLDSADGVCSGTWTREQLLAMDACFTAAVLRALELGLESRAAAAATYAASGKQRADEITVELAWRWFRDAKFEATAVEVIARCPGVALERVRVGFKQRLASWIGEVR